MKEESDVDDLIEMGRELHSFAPLNEKGLCCGKFRFRKRQMVSCSLAGVNVMKIANFVKFVRQIGRGGIIETFEHQNSF